MCLGRVVELVMRDDTRLIQRVSSHSLQSRRPIGGRYDYRTMPEPTQIDVWPYADALKMLRQRAGNISVERAAAMIGATQLEDIGDAENARMIRDALNDADRCA